MRSKTLVAAALAVLALGSPGSLWTVDQANAQSRWYRSYVIPAGTTIPVRLDSKISTENQVRGDFWTGTVDQSVLSNDRVMIPAGSQVEGVVTGASQGTHNSKATLDLAVRRVTVNGRSYRVNAETEPIVAGSHRAKKVGAIVGGAAAGGLLGHVVTGSKRGTLIGGLLGGAAGYGLTRHAMRTLQLKEGTVLTFYTREDMVARR